MNQIAKEIGRALLEGTPQARALAIARATCNAVAVSQMFCERCGAVHDPCQQFERDSVSNCCSQGFCAINRYHWFEFLRSGLRCPVATVASGSSLLRCNQTPK